MKKINQSVGFLIHYTTSNMRRYAKQIFQEKSMNITLDQWAVINILAENKGKLNHSELSKMTMKDRPTLTRIIDLLCKKGLTERRPSESDRRISNVILTEKGEKKVEVGYPIVRQIRTDLEHGLNQEDYDDLKRVLDKINNHVSKL